MILQADKRTDCGKEWNPKEFEENPSWDPAVGWCEDFFRENISLQLIVGSLGEPSEEFKDFFVEEISQLGAEVFTRFAIALFVKRETESETENSGLGCVSDVM